MSTRRPIPRATVDVIHQILHAGLRTPVEVADVFVNWSPHCGLVDVSIHVGGWHSVTNPTPQRKTSGYISDPEHLAKMRDQLFTDLKSITATGEVGPLHPDLKDRADFFKNDLW